MRGLGSGVLLIWVCDLFFLYCYHLSVNPTPHPGLQFLDDTFSGLQSLLLSLLQFQSEVSEVLLLVLLDLLQVDAPFLLLPKLLTQPSCLDTDAHITACFFLTSMPRAKQVKLSIQIIYIF